MKTTLISLLLIFSTSVWSCDHLKAEVMVEGQRIEMHEKISWGETITLVKKNYHLHLNILTTEKPGDVVVDVKIYKKLKMNLKEVGQAKLIVKKKMPFEFSKTQDTGTELIFKGSII